MQNDKSKFKFFVDSLKEKGFFRGGKHPQLLTDLWFVIFMLALGIELLVSFIVNKIFNLGNTTGYHQLDMVVLALFLGIPAILGIFVCRWVWKKSTGADDYNKVLETSLVLKDLCIFILAAQMFWLGIMAVSLRAGFWGIFWSIISFLFAAGMLIFNFRNASFIEILKRTARALRIAVLIIISIALISFIIINLTHFFA